MSNNGDTREKPKRGCGRFVLRGCLLLFLLGALAVVAAGFAGLMVYQHVTEPGVAGEPIKIEIPAGATGKQTAQILADNSLVEHPVLFQLALRLDRSGKTIRQGRYAIPEGLSASEILKLLQEGKTLALTPSEVPDDRKITVPEGLSIAQASQLFGNPEAFIEAASDKALIERLGIPGPTLEGFLMPNTYFFDKKPTEREVVERMVEQFENEYDALTRELPPPEAYTKLSIVTVASLVEEEARLADERPAVAAVIYNRLKHNMPLQFDSTLQFCLKKYGQRLLYEDREVDSPYNTYKNRGLPPGPICSPGVSALRAALAPAKEEYLYFVSNADGKSHTFSTTEAEHLKAVSKFRKEIAPQRKAIEEQKKNALP